MRGIIAALALAGAGTQAAAAPPPPCITPAQVTDVTLFALPAVLDGVASKCRASLPASAYLLTGGQALSKRLAPDAARHWQGAMAVLRTFGDKKMPEGLSAETMTGLLRDMIAAEALKKVTPADCTKINDIAEALAPLPPENLGRLIALMIEMGSDGKKGDFPRICR